jgi:D-alanyl-D-alanine dipeptidase
MKNNLKLIPDKELIKIPVKDNGEKLVYIKSVCPQIVIKLAKYIKEDGKKSVGKSCFVREQVAKRLNVAQKNLPKGYKLLLRCGYRSLALQKKRYDWMYKKVKSKNPNWCEEKIKEETDTHVAPIDIVPPHSTCGAVDLSILDANGKQLDMGAKFGEFNEKTQTNSVFISKKAKENRKLLISVMTRAGFINYPTEWWHWSFGDRYWAAKSKEKYSIYNSK